MRRILLLGILLIATSIPKVSVSTVSDSTEIAPKISCVFR